MSKHINDGGPVSLHFLQGLPVAGSLTLRDYFAANIANGDAAYDGGWGQTNDDMIAKRCALYYRIADAMLKAREGKQ